MAGTRRYVKVFLASPGDLVDERKIARAVVDEFNGQLAETLGYQVELVGWEDTLPGMGRPQEIINRDLDGCDLFVGMLWKRWGTPPGTKPYTSGFEEEFIRSLTRNKKEGSPEIHLLLKEFDKGALTDPGDQLKKVIDFKKKIVSEQKLLYVTFTDASDFEKKLRKCIQGYIINLRSEDQETASDNEQLPLAEAQTGSTTPLSAQGIRFLYDFANCAEAATDEKPIAAEAVARLRLLSIIAAEPGNDQLTLGPHDANLLFKLRAKFDFGRPEILALLHNGLDHFRHENVPLWHWLAVAGENILPMYSFFSSIERRIGALKAMRLVSAPIIDTDQLARKDFIQSWFSTNSNNALKVAALEYLSECGQYADLPYASEEYAANDNQTANAAAHTILRITLKNDRRAALDALYSLQPSMVDRELVADLFSRDFELESDILLRGLSHRCSLVRIAAIKLLSKRAALEAVTAEPFLSDSNAEVRFEALQVLVKNGRIYSIDQAKSILIQSNTGTRGLGLLALSQTDTVGELFFERFEREYFDSLTVAQLEDIDRSGTPDQSAFFALVRRNFKKQGNELRVAVSNQFLDRFDAFMVGLTSKFPGQIELLEKARTLETYLRPKFTREGLDIVCEKLDPADLPLVRSILAGTKIPYSSLDLAYLAKFGEWCDIPLVIASLERQEHRNTSTLLTSFSTKYDDAARALYALGKNRLLELLDTKMPDLLFTKLITLIPHTAFRDFPEAKIVHHLRSENETVRKIITLKLLLAFPRRRLMSLLEDYIAAEQSYYNVIHWLDFGISVSQVRMRLAVNRIMANPQ